MFEYDSESPFYASCQNCCIPSQAWVHTAVQVRRDLRSAFGQPPAQSSQLWGQLRLLRALIQSGIENLRGWRLHSLPGQPVPMCDCHPEGEKFFFKPSLKLSCFSLCLALSFDDLLVGTGGLLFSPLEVFPSPGWTGTPLAGAARSLTRPPGPFQPGCSPACCHFWANHRQAY